MLKGGVGSQSRRIEAQGRQLRRSRQRLAQLPTIQPRQYNTTQACRSRQRTLTYLKHLGVCASRSFRSNGARSVVVLVGGHEPQRQLVRRRLVQLEQRPRRHTLLLHLSFRELISLHHGTIFSVRHIPREWHKARVRLRAEWWPPSPTTPSDARSEAAS